MKHNKKIALVSYLAQLLGYIILFMTVTDQATLGLIAFVFLVTLWIYALSVVPSLTAPHSKPRGYSQYYRYKQLRSNGGKHTDLEWYKLKRRFGWRCACCQRSERDAGPLTKDHIIPVSRGGNDHISNLQPLCQSCNSSKGTKIIDYR
jgi:hypothetical protein